MDDIFHASEQISLFCRLNIHTKRELPVRSSEMGMLIYLCKSDGEKTPKGVAQFFKFSKAMATNMVASLQKKGYLHKIPALEDGRSFILCPTEKARELVDSTYEEYYKTMPVLHEKMGTDNFHALIGLLTEANRILLEEK